MPDALCVQTFSRRTKQDSRTFGEVAAAAGHAAAYYASHGLRPGDVVVLVGTHHIDFYAAWLGCVWLGAIPTVLAEPSVRVAKEINWSRLSDWSDESGLGAGRGSEHKIEQPLLAVPHVLGTMDRVAAWSPRRSGSLGEWKTLCCCSILRAQPDSTKG